MLANFGLTAADRLGLAGWVCSHREAGRAEPWLVDGPDRGVLAGIIDLGMRLARD
jgi:hypothetical protein